MSSTAPVTVSKKRASRPGSAVTTCNCGQRACDSRRRRSRRTPAALAAAEQAITRLANVTATGADGGRPAAEAAATAGQSMHHRASTREGTDEPLARRGEGTDEPLARSGEGTDEPLPTRAKGHPTAAGPHGQPHSADATAAHDRRRHLVAADPRLQSHRRALPV